MARDYLEMDQDGTRMAQEDPKLVQDIEDDPKMATRPSQEPPMMAKDG